MLLSILQYQPKLPYDGEESHHYAQSMSNSIGRRGQIAPDFELKTTHDWIGAYVPGWNQGALDPKKDPALDVIKEFLQFAVYFRPDDGSLDLRTSELTASKMKGLVKAAHKASKQVLLVVGGEGAAPGLRIAASPKLLQRTAESIILLVDRYGYDGVDVDWEPLTPQDADLYGGLVGGLRKGMDELARRQKRQRLALTTAIEVDLNNKDYMTSLVGTLGKLHEALDRINLMTYAMAIRANFLSYGTTRHFTRVRPG